jgi:hypothetical protein
MWASLFTILKLSLQGMLLKSLKCWGHYGFEISKGQVSESLSNPTRLDQKYNQHFAVKPLDANYALRVVYEKGKDI